MTDELLDRLARTVWPEGFEHPISKAHAEAMADQRRYACSRLKAVFAEIDAAGYAVVPRKRGNSKLVYNKATRTIPASINNHGHPKVAVGTAARRNRRYRLAAIART